MTNYKNLSFSLMQILQESAFLQKIDSSDLSVPTKQELLMCGVLP